MNIKRIGPYTLITGIKPLNKEGEIRQLYKDKSNNMIQLYITDSFIKKTVSDISNLKPLYESIKDRLSNIVKVVFDNRKM